MNQRSTEMTKPLDSVPKPQMPVGEVLDRLHLASEKLEKAALTLASRLDPICYPAPPAADPGAKYDSNDKYAGSEMNQATGISVVDTLTFDARSFESITRLLLELVERLAL